MNNGIVYQYLKAAWTALQERYADDSASDNDCPSIISSYVTGLLIHLQEKDAALFNTACSTLKEEIRSFFESTNRSSHALESSKCFVYFLHELCCAETQIIVSSTLSDETLLFENKTIALSDAAFEAFAHHFPEIKNPLFVYQLPKVCEESNDLKVSHFNGHYSHEEFATKEKVMCALLCGYEIERENSGLLTSINTIKEYGLGDNIVVSLMHKLKKRPNNIGSKLTGDTAPGIGLISPCLQPESAANRINSLVEVVSRTGVPLQIIKQEAERGASFTDYIAPAVKTILNDILASDLISTAHESVKKALKIIADINLELDSKYMKHPDPYAEPDAGQVTSPFTVMFQELMTYHCSTIAVMESFIEAANNIAAKVLSTPEAEAKPIKHYHYFAHMLEEALSKVALDGMFVKDTLRSLDRSKTNHISEVLHKILASTSHPAGLKLLVPKVLLSRYLPDHCMTDVISKGLNASTILHLMTEVYIKRNLQTCNLELEASQVIDTLVQVEKQYPGLIFQVDKINAETGYNIGDSSFNFCGVFAEQFFFSFDPESAQSPTANWWASFDSEPPITVKSWFSDKLMSRIAKDVMLENINFNELDSGHADISFLKPLSI